VANVDALAQLKDIHLPPPVGWWPLAPGWYGVMVLVFILLAFITAVIYKRHLNALPKKHALSLLKIYTAQYEKDHNVQLASARISELLKRVALVYFPRHQVASIHGQAWIEFLNQTSKGINFGPVKTMLLDSPFKHNEHINLHPLIMRTELWIKQRKVPCSN
jgi:hypothetical protein